ncbi:MAG: branched-chain amino acid transport system II carrier protein [Candidatus Babeliales bacterium]|jgi:LIVCS family branched-chain amino acid:cation transporter
MSKKSTVFTLGLATFTMFFGAGNIVFPLSLGRDMGNMVFYAILGFFITAIFVPLLGLISVMLFEGDYKKFLSTMGTIPANLIALICMILLGPFGCIARCIVLSYSAVQWHLPNISLFTYSLIASIFVFLVTQNKNRIVGLLGKYLGPIKLTLLLSVIAVGLAAPFMIEPTTFTSSQSFMRGFNDGYFTMDLICALFFSMLIYTALKKMLAEEGKTSPRYLIVYGIKSSLIGGGLLGVVYLGFCTIAAMYGPHIHGIGRDQILSALTTKILGHGAGILANATVAITCLTTAIALTTVFADYLAHELTKSKIRYPYALLITTVITFAMSNLGFEGIMNFVEPIIVVLYPALIVLCLANIASKAFGFRYIKSVVFTALIASLVFNYGQAIASLIIR